MPWTSWIRTVEIAPNMTVGEPAGLVAHVEALLRCGCRVFHLDVGRESDLSQLEPVATLVHRYEGVLDVELTSGADLLGVVLRGPDSITIDVDASDAARAVELAGQHGCQLGVTFPRSASPGWLPPVGLPVHLVSIAVEDSTAAVLRVREIVRSLPAGVPVQVKGDLTHESVRPFFLAGARVIVVGRAIFGREDLPRAYRRLVQALA
jgi:pentose-5-phosphate-3-epimerase